MLMALNIQPDQVFRFVAEVDLVNGIDQDTGKYQLERIYSGWEGGAAPGKTALRQAWQEGIS